MDTALYRRSDRPYSMPFFGNASHPGMRRGTEPRTYAADKFMMVKQASNRSHDEQLRFYARLQLFTLSTCGTIIALDTGDMLVTAPFLDDAMFRFHERRPHTQSQHLPSSRFRDAATEKSWASLASQGAEQWERLP